MQKKLKKHFLPLSFLLFAVTALALLAISYAGVKPGRVTFNVAEGSKLTRQTDTTAFNNDFVMFGPSTPGRVVIPNWPIKNIDFDNTQFTKYDETPSAQLPQEPFLGPVINKGVIKDMGGINPKAKGDRGAFRVRCKVSHFAYDDPIVVPGVSGGSHLHMFFGNTRTNATSTDDSILNTGASTCDGYHLNRTGYWVPTLHDANGDVVIPRSEGLFVYYKTFVDLVPGSPSNKELQPFPKGLKIVSGNVAAALDNKNYDVDWWCGPVRNNIKDEIHTQKLINCPKGDQMWMRIQFPYCWNGQNTYDTKNPHLVPPVGDFFSGKCPESHPKSIPAMTYQLGYDASSGAGETSQWFLSSDPRMDGTMAANGSTIHGDWYGGWNVQANERFLNRCLRVNFECSVGALGDGKTLLWPEWKYTIPTSKNGKTIPRSVIQQKLCPGDTDTVKTDIAMCMSKVMDSSQATQSMNAMMSRPVEAKNAPGTTAPE